MSSASGEKRANSTTQSVAGRWGSVGIPWHQCPPRLCCGQRSVTVCVETFHDFTWLFFVRVFSLCRLVPSQSQTVEKVSPRHRCSDRCSGVLSQVQADFSSVCCKWSLNTDDRPHTHTSVSILQSQGKLHLY